MNKIIFIDVDGTLVNYENQIPASAIEAIRQARQHYSETLVSGI